MNDSSGLFGLSSPAFGMQPNSEHSTPTPSSSFSHPLSMFAQNTPEPPSFPSRYGTAQMKLADLMANPYVEDLFNKWTDANSKATRYLEDQHRMLQQINSLQNDVFELRNELAAEKLKQAGAAQIPSSDNPYALPRPQPPPRTFRQGARRVARPEELPHSVLWLIDDVRQYEGLTSESNKSRPKMEACIRQNDGSVITSAEYSALQGVVRRFVAVNLTSLATPNSPAAGKTQRTRRWYRRWYPTNYQELLGRLEEAEPLLALCAGSWKADQLVGRHLYWLAEQAKKEGRQTGQKCTSSEGDLDFDEEWEDLPPNASASSSAKACGGSVPKKRRTTMGKNKENSAPVNQPVSALTISTPSLSIESQLSTLGQTSEPRPPLVPNDDNIDPKGHKELAPSGINVTQIKTKDGTSAGREPELDVSFIQIEQTLSSLRREFSIDFPTMSTYISLFDAMEAEPQFGGASPSPALILFIDTLETADPNSLDFSEDDTNAQWGHKQLSGTWKGILTSWDAVGSCDVVIRLLAALLKTCRVARYICVERRIHATSFLADMYLDQIIDQLWDLWKAAGGPISKGKSKPPPVSNTSNTATLTPSSTSSGQNSSTSAASGTTPPRNEADHRSEVEKMLKKLTKEELKSFLDAHGIKTTSRKSQPTKPEFIADVLSAPISSSEAVFLEIQARLEKRVPRGRNKDPKA